MVWLLRASQGRAAGAPRSGRSALTGALHHEKKTQRSMMIVTAPALGRAKRGCAALLLGRVVFPFPRLLRVARSQGNHGRLLGAFAVAVAFAFRALSRRAVWRAVSAFRASPRGAPHRPGQELRRALARNAPFCAAVRLPGRKPPTRTARGPCPLVPNNICRARRPRESEAGEGGRSAAARGVWGGGFHRGAFSQCIVRAAPPRIRPPALRRPKRTASAQRVCAWPECGHPR